MKFVAIYQVALWMFLGYKLAYCASLQENEKIVVKRQADIFQTIGSGAVELALSAYDTFSKGFGAYGKSETDVDILGQGFHQKKEIGAGVGGENNKRKKRSTSSIKEILRRKRSPIVHEPVSLKRSKRTPGAGCRGRNGTTTGGSNTTVATREANPNAENLARRKRSPCNNATIEGNTISREKRSLQGPSDAVPPGPLPSTTLEANPNAENLARRKRSPCNNATIAGNTIAREKRSPQGPPDAVPPGPPPSTTLEANPNAEILARSKRSPCNNATIAGNTIAREKRSPQGPPDAVPPGPPPSTTLEANPNAETLARSKRSPCNNATIEGSAISREKRSPQGPSDAVPPGPLPSTTLEANPNAENLARRKRSPCNNATIAGNTIAREKRSPQGPPEAVPPGPPPSTTLEANPNAETLARSKRSPCNNATIEGNTISREKRSPQGPSDAVPPGPLPSTTLEANPNAENVARRKRSPCNNATIEGNTISREKRSSQGPSDAVPPGPPPTGPRPSGPPPNGPPLNGPPPNGPPPNGLPPNGPRPNGPPPNGQRTPSEAQPIENGSDSKNELSSQDNEPDNGNSGRKKRSPKPCDGTGQPIGNSNRLPVNNNIPSQQFPQQQQRQPNGDVVIGDLQRDQRVKRAVEDPDKVVPVGNGAEKNIFERISDFVMETLKRVTRWASENDREKAIDKGTLSAVESPSL